ncbi:D-alanyl-D-alanine carboxypeptidase family protein [Garciella nitratireducens]|uniref:D-alanyl-D-alanine carboxypeptidase family protein n=1 Tax=Garciella nitratireducens TaxID=218205 RepID=UPI001BD1D1FC|nr:D-alanyl-D-alanine carboxypeptidase family protein [Garciella nitratireducens]
MIKKKNFIIALCILFLLTNLINTTMAAPNYKPNIKSPAAILIDAKTGQILYGKNINEPLYPASITKIMTALILLEEGDLNKVVKIHENVPSLIEPGSSQIYLLPGEKLTRKQLLYALLIESANDAAVAIAQDVAGSIENFADRMNEKAKELGATHSHFVNPHGLHDENHYTTAKDMAIITREAMKNPIFRNAVSTVRYIIPATEKQETRYLYNANRLIKKSTYKDYYYQGATGIKTGYTTQAQNTLVGGAKKGNLELISVVLNAKGTDIYEDTRTLLNYGFEHFTTKIIVRKGQVIKKLPLKNANELLPVSAKNTFQYASFKNSNEEITSIIKLDKDLSLPIKKGQIIGSIEYSLKGQPINTVPLVAEKTIEPSNRIIAFLYHIKIGKVILNIVVLFLLYRTFVFIRKNKDKKRSK